MTRTKPIWVVDDDHSIRFVLEKALTRENFAVRTFTNARDVLAAMAEVDAGGSEPGPQVLVSDIRMPGASGLELLAKIKAKHPGLPVIVMTAFSDLDSAVSAFQGGAFEYLPKPFDVTKAVELIRRAVEESLREAVTEEGSVDAPEMMGQASAMQDVFRAIGRLSQSTVTVLITGESGSGKELVARALHKHSPRKDGPFVAINTAAIPKDLLESELFGHERGAFTGAQTSRRGRFEQADGGTLFLDEIGDMPFDLQTRLLRVLSDGNYYRVGGHSAIKSQVRVIAATHQDLEQRVLAGSFREDLFHRLNVIRLRLPSLREREGDIPMLTRHFLKQSALQLGVEAKRISDPALAALARFAFPGNVRQLENICHWLTVMAPAQVVETKDLPPEVLAAGVDAAGAPVGAALRGGSQVAGVVASADSVVGAAAGASAAFPAVATAAAPSASAPASAQRGDADAHTAVSRTPVATDSEASQHHPSTFSGQTDSLISDSVAAANAAVAPAGAAAPGSLATSALVHAEHNKTPEGAGPHGLPAAPTPTWQQQLQQEASEMLALAGAHAGEGVIWDALSAKFERELIKAALNATRGRRIEAAQRLGIGRNTITRKIAELGLE